MLIFPFRKCVKNNFKQDIVFAVVKFSIPRSNFKENDKKKMTRMGGDLSVISSLKRQAQVQVA